MHGSSFLFTLCFILYYFRWKYSSWVTSKILSNSLPSWECVGKLGHDRSYFKKEISWNDFVYLSLNKKSMRSRDFSFRYIWSKNPALSLVRVLYRKIDKNISFYLRPFSAKTKNKIFQNSWETVFLGYFWPFLVIFVQRIFFPYKSAYLNTYKSELHTEVITVCLFIAIFVCWYFIY